MSTTYKGTTDWVITEPPAVSRNLYGSDVVSVKIGGPSTTLAATLATFKKGRTATANQYLTAVGFNYPWATLTDISTTPGRAFSFINLTYKGVANSMLPQPFAKGGTRLQSVTIPYIGDTLGESTGAVATFEYQAPYTTWHYVTRGRPEYAQEKRLYVTRDSIKIINRSGSPGSLVLFKGKSIESSEIFAGETLTSQGQIQCYNGLVEGIVSSLDFAEVGNNLWECSQTNEVRIVPLDIVNSGLLSPALL